MADGEVIFSTELDNKALYRDLNKAVKDIDRLDGKISKLGAQKIPLEEKLQRITGELDEAKAVLADMRAARLWIQDTGLNRFGGVSLTQRFESDKSFFAGWAQHRVFAPHADFITFPCQHSKKLPPGKALPDGIVHVLADGGAPGWLAAFFCQPFGIGLGRRL